MLIYHNCFLIKNEILARTDVITLSMYTLYDVTNNLNIQSIFFIKYQKKKSSGRIISR